MKIDISEKIIKELQERVELDLISDTIYSNEEPVKLSNLTEIEMAIVGLLNIAYDGEL
ncbi:MAG: hypothetical protein PHP08_00765 [Candidatus Dojkabacteria bacterium]|nr:hypothetical protein [Candidatus Dojkabacteria bacterium]